MRTVITLYIAVLAWTFASIPAFAQDCDQTIEGVSLWDDGLTAYETWAARGYEGKHIVPENPGNQYVSSLTYRSSARLEETKIMLLSHSVKRSGIRDLKIIYPVPVAEKRTYDWRDTEFAEHIQELYDNHCGDTKAPDTECSIERRLASLTVASDYVDIEPIRGREPGSLITSAAQCYYSVIMNSQFVRIEIRHAPRE